MATDLKQCSILVTDDDEGDRFLIRKAMMDSGIKNDVHFLEDGQKLVDCLTGHLEFAGKNAELPCLILLDLNMPRMDGREALRIVKGDSALKEIPIVVLTSSNNRGDVQSSYKDGANSFFTKPLDYKDMVGLMGLLKAYWLQAAKLPYEKA